MLFTEEITVFIEHHEVNLAMMTLLADTGSVALHVLDKVLMFFWMTQAQIMQHIS